MCQNSFHSIFPFTSSLLWKQEIRAAAWDGMQATTVNIVKWLHKTLSKIWNSFKEFQVCIQMFNPWKKKQLGRKSVTWSLLLIWALDWELNWALCTIVIAIQYYQFDLCVWCTTGGSKDARLSLLVTTRVSAKVRSHSSKPSKTKYYLKVPFCALL